MSATPLTGDQRRQVLQILHAALLAVDPAEAVRRHVAMQSGALHIGAASYPLAGIGRIIVVGAGKAGTPMAAALYEILGDRIDAGAVTVKHGHTAAAGGWRVRFGHAEAGAPPPARAQTGPIVILEAGHPVPDQAGLDAAQRLTELLGGLTARDLVIVLISGGGSALLPLPVAGVSLDDYRALTNVLLRSGADITEINTVRKHCSRLQGGQLARLAAPARVATLILSDVVGTPLDAVASGPTVPDPTTYGDALAVFGRYGVEAQVPASIRKHLRAGAEGRSAETPKPGDPVFDAVDNLVIGDNASAGRAAVAEARRLGFNSMLLTSFVQGEAREAARVLAGLAHGIATGQSDYAAPACLVCGGETTVTLRGPGKGGRNQELALAAGISLGSQPAAAGSAVAVVSFGTDGTDGPTDAAGGIGAGDTLSRAAALGIDVRAALADNDSYPCLERLGDLIVTGPTQTNVNDLMLVLCWQTDGRLKIED